MFDDKIINKINTAYDLKITEAGDYFKSIDNKIQAMDKELSLFVKYLYAYMPSSDMINYALDVFVDYATHSLYLYDNFADVKELPAELFLEYVLFHRVNEEEIRPCRRLFYDNISEFLGDTKDIDRILRANFWCAGQITYQASDERTLSAVAVYNRGRGRCGEESTFLVQVLRSIGIPARQVYAPRWSHCDDNHAWVEAYNNGKWYFIGAAEPQGIINFGWFNNAASRAMLVHSRCFGEPLSTDTEIGRENDLHMLNQLDRYAETNRIKIKVLDSEYKPVKAANVTFSVINYSHFTAIANTVTNDNGETELLTGLGSLKISVYKDDLLCEAIINAGHLDDIYLVLEKRIEDIGDIDECTFVAPNDSPINADKPSRDIVQKTAQELAELSKLRENKLKSFKNPDIERFKDEYANDKCAKLLLSSLSKKDLTDVRYDILVEQMLYAKEYLGTVDDDIFAKYIICPRVLNEVLSPYRAYILDYFSSSEIASFKEKPWLVWQWVDKNILNDEKPNKQLYLFPISALKIKKACRRDKKLLTVAILRSIGVAAGINKAQYYLEYYNNGAFVPIETLTFGNLKIEKTDDNTPIYMTNFSIAKINREYQDSVLDLDNVVFTNNAFTLKLLTGIYRMLSTIRLADGNQIFYQRIIDIYENSETKVKLRFHKIDEEEMLVKLDLPNIYLNDAVTDKEVSTKELLDSQRDIYLYLEESREPTEHILNEINERYDSYNQLQQRIVFIVSSKAALKDENISNTLKRFPNIRIMLDKHFSNLETIGRRMYVDHEKLPFIFVLDKEHNGIYADSGYNVGSAEMLLNILSINK